MQKTIGGLLFLMCVLAGLLTVATASAQDSLADRARAVRGAAKVTEFVSAESGIALKAPEKWVWQKVNLPDTTWKADCNTQLLAACRVWIRSFPLPPGRTDVTETDIRKWHPEFYQTEERSVESGKPVVVNGRRAYEVVWLGHSITSMRSRNLFIVEPSAGRVFQLTLEAHAGETRNYFLPNASAFQAMVDSFMPSTPAAHRDFTPRERKAFELMLGLMMAQEFFKMGNKRYASIDELIGRRRAEPEVKAVLDAFAISTEEIPGGLRITVAPRNAAEGTFACDGKRVTYKPPRGGAMVDLGDPIEIMSSTATQ